MKRNFKTLYREIISFGMVGIFNTAAMYLLFSFLVWVGVAYRFALATDYIVGAAISFFLNKKITFRHKGPVTLRMIAKTAAWYGGFFIFNYFLLESIIRNLGVNVYIGQLIALAGVVILSYLFQKIVVFQHKKQDESGT